MKKLLIGFILGLVSLFTVLAVFIAGIYFSPAVVRELENLPLVGAEFSEIFNKTNQANKSNVVNKPYETYLPLKLEGQEPVVAVAEQASKSVVTVSIKKTQLQFDPFSLEDFFNFPFGNLIPKQGLKKEVEKDIGSGFVVEGGFVITNKHVVSETEASYKVIDNSDKEYEVSKIYRDPVEDLAILKVTGLSVPALSLGDSSKIKVGQTAIAIGTALGEFRHTVTTGVISGLGRGIIAGDPLGRSEENLEGLIQTSAAINPGNSGGPLLGLTGEVLGVNVAVAGDAQNIGFAIPINVAKDTLNNFTSTGQFERPLLGVKYQIISEKAALVNEVPKGAYVLEVVPNSSADGAGIVKGDIIVEFDGVALSEKNSLSSLINKKKVGDKVKVKIYKWESKETKELQVTMKEG